MADQVKRNMGSTGSRPRKANRNSTGGGGGFNSANGLFGGAPRNRRRPNAGFGNIPTGQSRAGRRELSKIYGKGNFSSGRTGG